MEKLWHTLGSFFSQGSHSNDASKTLGNTHCCLQNLPEPTAVWLHDLLGFTPAQPDMYIIALTHKSVLHDQEEPPDSNQRLEFLGDAVLDLIISEHLYTAFPESDEGQLSGNRAKIVNRTSLAGFAKKIALGEHLFIGKSADKTKIQASQSALADALEALIGAVYLDAGLVEARKFIMRHITGHIDLHQLDTVENNYKSRLIEYAQSQQMACPVYTVVSEEGAEHEKRFTMEVSCDNRPLGRGGAGRKKDAEQLAAREALAKLESETDADAE